MTEVADGLFLEVPKDDQSNQEVQTETAGEFDATRSRLAALHADSGARPVDIENVCLMSSDMDTRLELIGRRPDVVENPRTDDHGAR